MRRSDLGLPARLRGRHQRDSHIQIPNLRGRVATRRWPHLALRLFDFHIQIFNFLKCENSFGTLGMRHELPGKRRRDLLPNCPNISLQPHRVIQGFKVGMFFRVSADGIGH
jgi:hypothetical protein